MHFQKLLKEYGEIELSGIGLGIGLKMMILFFEGIYLFLFLFIFIAVVSAVNLSMILKNKCLAVFKGK